MYGMGDVLPPGRSSAERMRRRMELYNKHHAGVHDRYDQSQNGHAQREMDDTEKLRQIVLEAKAKKNKKESNKRVAEINSDNCLAVSL